MATKYSPCPEAEEIGRELIIEHHKHLIGHAVRVEFLLRNDVAMKNGREVWVEVKKISGLNAYLPVLDRIQKTGEVKDAEPFFVIIVPEPRWRHFTDLQKRACLDHGLMQCWAEDSEQGLKLITVSPDFAGFFQEIERYGLWREDAEKMAKTMRGQEKQMALSFDDLPRRRKLLREEASDGIDSITVEAAGRSVKVTPQQFDRAVDLLETGAYSGKLAAAGPDPDESFESLSNAVTHTMMDVLEGGSRRR